jgi:hypothetical protein
MRCSLLQGFKVAEFKLYDAICSTLLGFLIATIKLIKFMIKKLMRNKYLQEVLVKNL